MSALCQKRTHAVQHKTDKRSPRRCVGKPILDPSLAARRSVWNAVSAFEVALLASMSSGTTSWIAIIELDAASASRFSKSCKALARVWSPSIRAEHDSRGRSKKASLVAIAKIVCGRPSSTFFGLGAGSTIRHQALTKDEAIAVNVAKLPEPVAQIRFPTAQS